MSADELTQLFTWVRPHRVRLSHPLVCRCAAQLPGHLAPQRAHLRAVRLDRRGAWGQVRANEHDTSHLGWKLSTSDEVLNFLGQLGDRCPGHQVPQSQHRVRLAATKVGLKVDDRARVSVPTHATNGPVQQLLEAFGQEGAAEELHRVDVLPAQRLIVAGERHHVQVGCELTR